MSEQFKPEAEKDFLNSLVSDYKDVSPYSQIKKEIILSLIDEYIINPSAADALQMGCANGYETDGLAGRFGHLTVIDGSSVFIDRVSSSNTHANTDFILTLFEDFHSGTHSGKYDYIFCNYILEHVFDTQVILKNMRSLLKPGGLMFVVVPNAYALSRQLAREMGLVQRLEDLTENDHKHGHRRVYNEQSIQDDVQAAGFRIRARHGLVFKILADFQLNKLLQDGFLKREHIIGLQKLAQGENIRFSDSFFLVLESPE